MRKKVLATVLTNQALPTAVATGKPAASPISRGLEKPTTAAPAATECGEPAAFTPGPASYRAGPTPTIDGMAYLIAEILWPEAWPPAHNRDLWGAGPDGMYGNTWRNDATDHSYDD
jgi:hypothetical protein